MSWKRYAALGLVVTFACAAPSRSLRPTAAQADPLRPAWIDGYCERGRFLCGVGSGENVEAAEVKARKNLALIFEANIRSVSESFERASQTVASATGEQWEEVQKIREYSMVETDRALETTDIIERWDDGQGTVWALAVIDRQQRSQDLRSQIGRLDATVDDELARAEGADSELKRFPPLRRAMAALAERTALEADLRIIDVNGRGAPAEHTLPEVLSLLSDTRSRLRIGLSVAGKGAKKVARCLENGLTDAGHEIAKVEVDERAQAPFSLQGLFDVLIEAGVESEALHVRSGTHTVKAELTLRMIDGKSGKTLRTESGNELGSRPSFERALKTAAVKVCKKQVPKMVEAIDSAFNDA